MTFQEGYEAYFRGVRFNEMNSQAWRNGWNTAQADDYDSANLEDY